MRTLTPADTVWISGHGRLYTFHAVPGLDPRALQGQQVECEGRVRTVTAVETFCIMDATNTPFGLVFADVGDPVDNASKPGPQPLIL